MRAAEAVLTPQTSNSGVDGAGAVDPDDFFTSLTRLSSSSPPSILFRVHDSTSLSPLIWTGHHDTSGFQCTNLNLAYLSPAIYGSFYPAPGPLSTTSQGATSALDGPYLRHTMVDHILGRRKQTCVNTPSSLQERPGTPEDEKSPWISCSGNLFWCLWEVCRRLAYLKRGKVNLAVVTYPGSAASASAAAVATATMDNMKTMFTDDPETETETEAGDLVDINPPPQATATATECLVLPVPRIQASLNRSKEWGMSVSLKESYELARDAARESGEVLVWGRIWAESVKHDYEFTSRHCPLTLPAHFFPTSSGSTTTTPHRPEKTGSKYRWLRELIWDPWEDDYQVAYRKLLARRQQLARENGEGKPLTPI